MLVATGLLVAIFLVSKAWTKSGIGLSGFRDDDFTKEEVFVRDTLKLGMARPEGDIEEDVESDPVPTVCLREKSFLVGKRVPPLLLASFPGSGNTWIRHVIQEATRVWTGSMYRDDSLLERFPGEGIRSGLVSAVKTHYPCLRCWARRKAGGGFVPVEKTGNLNPISGSLYLLRNPFDAILAEFNRMKAHSHTGGIDDFSIFSSNEWTSFAEDKIQAWKQSVQFYLNDHISGRDWEDKEGRRVILLFFEEFVANFSKESRIMLEGLKQMHPSLFEDASISDMLRCAQRDETGSFKRKHLHKKKVYGEGLRRLLCEEAAQSWQEQEWGRCM